MRSSALRSLGLVCLASFAMALLAGCATRIPAEVAEDRAFVVFPHSTKSEESGTLYFDYRIELKDFPNGDQTKSFMVRAHLGEGLTVEEFDEPGVYNMQRVVFVSKRQGRNSVRSRTGLWDVKPGHINIYKFSMNTNVEGTYQRYQFVRLSASEIEALVERLHQQHPESRGWPINIM